MAVQPLLPKHYSLPHTTTEKNLGSNHQDIRINNLMPNKISAAAHITIRSCYIQALINCAGHDILNPTLMNGGLFLRLFMTYGYKYFGRYFVLTIISKVNLCFGLSHKNYTKIFPLHLPTFWQPKYTPPPHHPTHPLSKLPSIQRYPTLQ